LDHSESLHQILMQNREEGNESTQKFFLNRRVISFSFFSFFIFLSLCIFLTLFELIFLLKRISVDSTASETDQGVLRVYSNLDVDVAYRALFIDVTMNTEQVIAMTLEKYNSAESAKDFQLSVQFTGSRIFLSFVLSSPSQFFRSVSAFHSSILLFSII